MWALKGTGSILRTFNSHEKVNVIGAINPFEDEGIYGYIETLNAVNFERFLRKIVEVYGGSGKIYTFLDNARSHHAKLLKPFLESLSNGYIFKSYLKNNFIKKNAFSLKILKNLVLFIQLFQLKH